VNEKRMAEIIQLPIQLPIWPDKVRGVPNSILRSALPPSTVDNLIAISGDKLDMPFKSLLNVLHATPKDLATLFAEILSKGSIYVL
jgi:hypothetical protein